MSDLFPIIHEDETLLVVNKPAGLVCHPTKGDAYSSLISRLRLYLGAHTEIHFINRLDRETSGVTLVGKQHGIATELRKQWVIDRSNWPHGTELRIRIPGNYSDASASYPSILNMTPRHNCK